MLMDLRATWKGAYATNESPRGVVAAEMDRAFAGTNDHQGPRRPASICRRPSLHASPEVAAVHNGYAHQCGPFWPVRKLSNHLGPDPGGFADQRVEQR
jgi:hypothetical protein